MTSILWVTSEAPDSAVGGGAVRQAHLLEGLAGRVDRVDLLLAGRLGEDDIRARLGRVTEVPAHSAPAPASLFSRRLGDLWKTFVLRLPAEVHDRRVDRRTLARALSSLAAGSYDVVHVEHLGLAGVVPPTMPGLRSLDVQNVPSRMSAQALALEAGRRQQILRGGELAAARRFQARALRTVDLLSVVSAEDAADLGAGAASRPARSPRVVVVPNGVDLDRFPDVALPAGARLVFTGTLDFLPNSEGIEWFVREVLPLVRADLPEVTLDIVGRRPTTGVMALGGLPGVRVQADVDDVIPLLNAARVAVVPVRIGSGSRLKVLEAMAAGRPVASTSIGVEGLSVTPGREAMVADQPGALAAAVVELCRDDAQAARMAAAGRRLVEERYRWDRIAADYGEAVVAAIDDRRRQSS